MTIESEEFYNLCHRYRFANICNQAEVSVVYQDLINFIDAEITSLREQLEKAKKDGWISVQDRLPEEHLLAGGNWTYSEKVIVFNSDGVNIQRFVNGDCFGNPTHWQPLPEPPKE